LLADDALRDCLVTAGRRRLDELERVPPEALVVEALLEVV
jgi:hypothetical protein